MKKLLILILFTISVLSLFGYFSFIKNYESYVVINDPDGWLDDYLIRVVSCEMPALYEEEALKAQTIAARTFYYYEKNIDSNSQCYLTDDDMDNKWGIDKDKYIEKIKEVVNVTDNLVMYKDDELFKSFYFSTSNGYTESSMYVFSEGNIESVASPWDLNSKNYEYEVEYTKEYLITIFGNFNNISIESRNSTNHVEYVCIDDQKITGIEFRKKLNLRSTDFDIKVEGDKYIIKTYGYGHGVGMSQYGANELAKIGYSYDEILKYYYGDIEIENY